MVPTLLDCQVVELNSQDSWCESKSISRELHLWFACKLQRCSNPSKQGTIRYVSCVILPTWLDCQVVKLTHRIASQRGNFTFDLLASRNVAQIDLNIVKTKYNTVRSPRNCANLTGLPSCQIDSQDCESKPIARELHLWFCSKLTGLPTWNKSVKSLACNSTAKSSVNSSRHLLTNIPTPCSIWATRTDTTKKVTQQSCRV